VERVSKGVGLPRLATFAAPFDKLRTRLRMLRGHSLNDYEVRTRFCCHIFAYHALEDEGCESGNYGATSTGPTITASRPSIVRRRVMSVSR
jgi:hypothetical protein